MSIHILVLNYQRRDLLEECLPSVWEACKAASVPCRLSVVDNASQDDSETWLKENLPDVGWIPCPKNLILMSYNPVVAALGEEAMLLLNNDIKVEKNFIAPLWECLKGDPNRFCASPKHLDFQGAYNGGMNRFGFRLSLPWAGPFYRESVPERDLARETLFTGNGLFDRAKFLALGGFDTLYAPMGWEDADLCTRAWRRGWNSFYEPRSVIYHKSSASISKSFQEGERQKLGFRNAVLWFFANFSAPTSRLRFWLLLPLTLLLLALSGRLNQIRGFWAALPRLEAAKKRRRHDRAFDKVSDAELFRRLGGSR